MGNATAMKNVGLCYEHGTGVKKSPSDALTWYRAAQKAGVKNLASAIRRVQPSTGVKTISAGTFRDEVIDNRHTSLVYFRGGDALSRVFDRVFDHVSKQFAGSLRFVRLEQSADTKALFERYGIKGTPAVLFFKGGRPAGAPLLGVRSKKAMAKAIEGMLKPN